MHIIDLFTFLYYSNTWPFGADLGTQLPASSYMSSALTSLNCRGDGKRLLFIRMGF